MWEKGGGGRFADVLIEIIRAYDYGGILVRCQCVGYTKSCDDHDGTLLILSHS